MYNDQENTTTESSQMEHETHQAQSASNAGSSEEALHACQMELAKYKDVCARVSADFENFKKRTEREKANWIATAQSNVLFDLLGVVDDFERAMTEAESEKLTDACAAWVQGMRLIQKALEQVLHKYGVSKIEQMTTFDPELHEALVHVDSEQHESGHIVQVMQKGYLFKEHVLRPAKVTVAK